jgi:hypothetical protein
MVGSMAGSTAGYSVYCTAAEMVVLKVAPTVFSKVEHSGALLAASKAVLKVV